MEIRYRQDIGNTGTTIQVRHSAGICAAISSLHISIYIHGASVMDLHRGRYINCTLHLAEKHAPGYI